MEIMGILNVTPDSFSDGGEFSTPHDAITHAHTLIAAGATIIDIGGESTRPGATAITADEEWQRIAPVVTALVSESEARISVDTYHAQTARRAIDAGADIINDVTGGRVDADMFSVIADSNVDYVLQHSRGGAATTNNTAVYDDVVADVMSELDERLAQAEAAGIDTERIIIDPGLGFSKVGDHDWQIITHIDTFTSHFANRVLVGHSRKRFLGKSDLATALVSAHLRDKVWGIRVHDVAGSAEALHVADRLHNA